MSTAGRFKWLAAMIAVMAMMMMASAAFAQEKPKIAVYVTSGADKSMAAKMLSSLGAHKTVGDGLAKAIGGVGKCDAVNLTGDITKEYGDAVSEAQAAAIGRQFGVQYLSIVTISNVRGKTFSLGIRLVDAASARPIATASAAVDLGNAPGLLQALAKIALELVNGIATSAVQGVAQGAIGGGAVAASAPMGQPAASGQPAPMVAVVYMFGKEPEGAAGAHMVIGEELAKAMSRGGNRAVNRTDDILELLAEEYGDTLYGLVDESRIKTIEDSFGIKYLCAVEIKVVGGNSYYLSARMIDAATGETISTASAASNLSNSGEMANAAREIAAELAGGLTGAMAAPQVQEAMPVQPIQQAYETMSTPVVQETAPVQPVYKTKTKNVWSKFEEPDSKSRRLENRINVEIGGAFSPYTYYSYRNWYNISEEFSSLGGGGYIDIDLIYAEILLNVITFSNSGIAIGGLVAKYPIVLGFVKVSPLLGLGGIYYGGLMFGGRVDVGISEIAYLRSEYLYVVDGGSSFKIGGGLDIGLGERKRIYLRPELLYSLVFWSGNESGWGLEERETWHSIDMRLGIGYKWGGVARKEYQVEVKPKDESKKWLSAGTGGLYGNSGGFYVFFDATYAEAFLGNLSVGALGKYPFGSSDRIKFFPLAGFEYYFGLENGFALLGAGIDVDVYQDVYLRAEPMYNIGKINFVTIKFSAGYRF